MPTSYMIESLQSDKTVLIASSSVDRATWEPVAKEITDCGYEVLVYEADKVALGEVPLDMVLDKEHGLEIRYNNSFLCLNAIGSAWYRRTTLISDDSKDGAAQIGLDAERKAIQGALWEMLPDQRWLNAPEQIRKAERKISQLLVAQQIGFDIPVTTVTNQWQTIHTALPSEIICKASYSVMYDGSGFKALFTTPFENNPATLPLDHNPFPGLWQPYLSKAREWRVTVVGDEVFEATIYTSDEAKDDWRKHQNYANRVEFRSESLPDNVQEKCLQYLDRFGLRFGAFDFVEDHDGRIVFLECNPNGQFMWLEQYLGLPISKSIAAELIRIASLRPYKT
ncbi:MAG: hypothetical protein HY226_04640 [Candidatus Vogelbacteria bacterium]|nr:hypothetical protein [Candidatus Vogelbacteria bacterium]